MTFKALHTDRPPYLSDLLQHHEPKTSLCSSSSHQLLVPRHKLTFGPRAFRFSAPRVWNSLPNSIRETKSLPTFRIQMSSKDILFSVGQSPFGCPSCLEYLHPCTLILLKTLALYKPCTYLLTYTWTRMYHSITTCLRAACKQDEVTLT